MDRFRRFWKSKNAAQKTRLIMLTAMIISLIPMFLIARYDYMGADDYSYSILTRHAWVETHNFFSLAAAFFRQIRKSYMTWQGSYTCIILSALQPGVLNEHFYGIGPVILLLLLVGSSFYSCRILMGELLDHKEAGDISAASIVILCTQIPPHTLQGFYWWNGAVNYLPFFCLLMVLTARCARVFFLDKASVRDFIITAFLAFLAAGGNYVVTLVIVEASVLFFLLELLLKAHTRRYAFGIMMVSLVGMALNLLSPGNFVRMGSYSQEPLGVVESIRLSIRYGLAFCSDQMTVLFWLCILIPVPFFISADHSRIEEKIRKIPSVLFIVALFLLLASSFSPTMMIEHSEGPRRAQNARFFMWVFFSILSEVFFVCKFMIAIKGDEDGPEVIANLKRIFRKTGLRSFYIAIGFLAFINLDYSMVPRENRDMISCISATRSLLIGEAQAYGQEMEERYKAFHSDEKDIVVPVIRNHPKLVYFSEFDMDPSADDWKNRDMAEYYYKNSISAE